VSLEEGLACLRSILGRGEMARKRAPYAKRSVWYVVIVLAAIVVIGFAVAGYEINHLRTEYDGLHTTVQNLNKAVSVLYSEVLKLAAQRSP
jgi:outer membrane murein-binding lipoprotein Lpp